MCPGRGWGVLKRLRGKWRQGDFQVQIRKDQAVCGRGLHVQAHWWKNHFLRFQTGKCVWWRKHLRTISLFQAQVKKGVYFWHGRIGKWWSFRFQVLLYFFCLFLPETSSITLMSLMSKHQTSNQENHFKNLVAISPLRPPCLSFLGKYMSLLSLSLCLFPLDGGGREQLLNSK